ncbi:MAG: cobalamin biosynthesis protein CbiA [Deltaproteobacteria bacterium]|nr:cobalamin biosynthesis protein CbiA [Deltaproteobacteria bacterium]
MKHYTPAMARSRVTVFTGNFGSGKTEVAVNFTLLLAAQETGVRIADLDIVNPYFRCREASGLMEKAGVEVIAPAGGWKHADLPIILPQIKGMVESKQNRTVLDVGGDPVGARILGSLAGSFVEDELDLIVVLNGNRPFTDTVDGACKMIEDIQEASRLSVTGLVGNTHLMESTTSDVIRKGEDLLLEVSGKLGLPVRFVTVGKGLLAGWSGSPPRAPVLALTRHMMPPWIESEKQGSEVFKNRDGSTAARR